jgi:hypothetical protein
MILLDVLSLAQDLTVNADVSVTGELVLDGRLELTKKPLSFPYPGLNAGLPVNLLDAVAADSASPLAYYLYAFAIAGQDLSATSDYYELALPGGAFYQLEPVDLDLPMVHRISTTNYQVGDIIMLKGSSEDKIIAFWDFEDMVNVIASGLVGNLYNGRDMSTASVNFYTEYLYSDDVFIYMYSPRTRVGVAGSTVQTQSIDWVLLN